jgi:hypothetical protein
MFINKNFHEVTSSWFNLFNYGYTFNGIYVFEGIIMLHGLSTVNVPFCLQLGATLEASANKLCGNYNVHFFNL